ncbi:membrane dipeptidase [Prevotella dentalis DSM 3688]|uniref:Membrane dipeptidase n=1 Tax=Prevotella dentalis (strain ATCC 49559 / DSM 3688 / JCM 13448 / NCTC 12043 / ES 2772) TaxID=908937 RepID=F9D783_PREDD|nr:membrane dipeptidase [Prevotella dentalis DSM 3688]
MNGFEKGCALIRSNLHVDPTAGSYEDWAALYAQAIWLERWRGENWKMLLSGSASDNPGKSR